MDDEHVIWDYRLVKNSLSFSFLSTETKISQSSQYRRHLYRIPAETNPIWSQLRRSRSSSHFNIWIIPASYITHTAQLGSEPHISRRRNRLDTRLLIDTCWNSGNLHLWNPVRFFLAHPHVDAVFVRYWNNGSRVRPWDPTDSNNCTLELLLCRHELTHEVAHRIRSSQTDWYNVNDYFPPRPSEFCDPPRNQRLFNLSNSTWN